MKLAFPTFPSVWSVVTPIRSTFTVTFQSNQCDPGWQVEEDEEWGEEDVHHGGQGFSWGAEKTQPRLLEA